MLKQFDPRFPANCPPPDAVDAEGTMFRLVKKQLPDVDDFKSHHEMGLAPNADACDRCGLSIYADQKDAVRLYRRVVERHGPEGTQIGRFVARLTLCQDHGLMKATPNRRHRDSHHTWWPYSGSDRLSSFSQIVEDAGHALGS